MTGYDRDCLSWLSFPSLAGCPVGAGGAGSSSLDLTERTSNSSVRGRPLWHRQSQMVCACLMARAKPSGLTRVTARQATPASDDRQPAHPVNLVIHSHGEPRFKVRPFASGGVRAAEGFSESPTRSLYRLIVEIARQNHRGAAERKKYNTSTEMPSSLASRSSTEFSGGVESIVFKVVEVRCHRLTAISATDPFRDVLLLQSGRLAGGHDIFVSSCVPKIAPFLVPPLAS